MLTSFLVRSLLAYNGYRWTSSCQEYKPVLLLSALNLHCFQNAQPIIKSGKSAIVDDLMFINDVNKGFHKHDYTDPKKPIRLHL
jgi:hypothetical protein